jgi:hypothetical protein
MTLAASGWASSRLSIEADCEARSAATLARRDFPGARDDPHAALLYAGLRPMVRIAAAPGMT